LPSPLEIKSRTFSLTEKFPLTFVTSIVTILLSYTPTPIQEIHDKALSTAGVRLLVKREDLNHAYISGNKWWKLKYNLQEAALQKKETLLTFGGAYSNHIFSTAAAAKELGFKSIGIIRGEETWPLNNTLSFAKQCGMHLQYCTRDNYRKKHEPAFIDYLKNELGDFFLIPEGGSNDLAVEGCSELGSLLLDSSECHFDYLCLPVGTGGTMAGLIKSIGDQKKIVGFPVLKGAEFLQQEIENFLPKTKQLKNWSLELSYHFGGYAKTTKPLLAFIAAMETEHALPLDCVYTGKLMWGIWDCVREGKFKRGTTILALHTGGLQDRIK